MKEVKSTKMPDLFEQFLNDTQSILTLFSQATENEGKNIKEIKGVAEGIENSIISKSRHL
nr:hypothetical protein [Fredinandcohnia onubensis]